MKRVVSAFVLGSFLLFSSVSSVFASGNLVVSPTNPDGSTDTSAPISTWGGLLGWLGWVIAQAGSQPPIAQPKSVILFEDTANFPIDVQYSDHFQRSVSFQIASNPANGTVSVVDLSGGNGQLLYTPRTDFNGADSFEYTVTLAGSLVSAPALVTVAVQAVNDAPQVSNLNQIFDHNLGHSISFPLGPAKDVDGDNLNYAIVQNLDPNIATASISGTQMTINMGSNCQNGIYTLIFSVSDGAITQTAQVNVDMRNCPPPAGGGHPHPSTVDVTKPFVQTHHDKIPRFEHIQNAKFLDGSPRQIYTITEDVPSLSAFFATHGTPHSNDVLILTGDVVYDLSDFSVYTLALQPGAHLKFLNSQSTRLKVVNLTVDEGAHLEVGSVSEPIPAPHKAEIIVRDAPLERDTDVHVDPKHYGHGIIIYGKVTMHGQSLNRTFARLASDALAGATSLSLAEAISNWELTDGRILLSDSRQTKGAGEDFGEELNISSVSADGFTIYLTNPLKYAHKGDGSQAPGYRFMPHVAILSRNVQIKSENPSGVRGHMMLTGSADADIRFVQFQDMGRTTLNPLDLTTFDASGNVTHIGTNQIGRYPIHCHHLIGPKTPQANGYQFTLVGNAVANSRKWGITVHGSHYGLIQDNVVYDAAGFGIGTEDGSETKNVFDHNFISRVSAWGSRGDERLGSTPPDLGIEGACMWFRGPNNFVRNNVCAFKAQYGYSYWLYFLDNKWPIFYPGTRFRIPTKQGDDNMSPGQYVEVTGNAMPVLEFDNNEVYGTKIGLTFWWIGYKGTSTPQHYQSAPESVFKNFKAWHMSDKALFGYPAYRITMDGWVLRNNVSDLSNGYNGTLGFNFDDYYSKDFIIKNADVQGFKVGIFLPTLLDDDNARGDNRGLFTVQDSYLRNFYNVELRPANTPGCGKCLHDSERRIVLRNVTFGPTISGAQPHPTAPSDARSQLHIWMNGQLYRKPSSGDQIYNVEQVRRNEMLIYDYNGVSGSHYQVFFTEQDPNFVVSQTANNTTNAHILWGSPVAGLTNQQNYDAYGLAVAGRVMPTGATTASWTNGRIRPLPSDIAQSVMSPITVSNKTSNSATLNWTNDESVRVKVLYGISASLNITGGSSPAQMIADRNEVYANQTNWSPFGSSHSVTLTGLQSGKKYVYSVVCEDAAGNVTVSKRGSFVTL